MSDPNDVLVRLRAFYTSETCREAADEIERLRAVVDAWITYSSQAEAELRARVAELEAEEDDNGSR